METERKLHILAEAAKYDVSCASSGGKRKNHGGLGNSEAGGICHTWTADGRCVSLLKVLMSNQCVNSCVYCTNHCNNDVERATFSPRELANLAISFYRRNYIEGVFLSSGVVKNADYTMERLYETLRILREEENFHGYVHVKAIPGSDPLLLEKVGRLADRMSVNIELPTQDSLKLLAPEKTKENLLTPMGYIRDRYLEQKSEKRTRNFFVPAGQSTQMIIGATPESDRTIVRLSQALYRKMSLKRVYYSAYIPAQTHPLLPTSRAPLVREHRLYQSDFLLRFYGFEADELFDERHENLDLAVDPKASWALVHPEFFPVEVNRAPLEVLLRVPGIGVTSANRILQARRIGPLRAEDLPRLGMVFKRARHFLTCQGKYLGQKMDPSVIRPALTDPMPAHMLGDQMTFLSQMEFPTLPQGGSAALPGPGAPLSLLDG